MRILERVRLITISVVAATAIGCGSDPVASQCEPTVVEAALIAELEQQAELFGAENRRWHLSLDRILATAPRDSVVTVAFQLRVTQHEFAELVAERDGFVSYWFQTFNALTVRIPVGGLASIIMDHPDSFIWISGGRLPIPTLRSGCGGG